MLEVERFPSHLSPSALNMAENMPNTFYILRLRERRFPRDPQHISAAVGSAFDYCIKEHLIHKKFEHKRYILIDLAKGIETEKEKAWKAGRIICDEYIKNGFNVKDFADIEIVNTFEIDGVPIMVKLDASVIYIDSSLKESIEVPFDWKVMGYNSDSNLSPFPKYFRLFEGMRPKAKHPDYYEGIPFESVQPKFAKQLCTYGWQLNNWGHPFPGFIDGLFIQGTKIRIAKYKGWFSPEYQRRVLNSYKVIWKEINSGEYIKRLAHKSDVNVVWFAAQQERWW